MTPAAVTAATVGTSATVGSATVIATASMNRAAAMISAATGITTRVSASAVVTCIAASVRPAGIAPSVSASVAARVAWATISTASPISTMTPAIPGADTDERSANEPLRTVEAVRRTGIRVIGIVPVRTYRRTTHISWAGVSLIGIAAVGIALIGWPLVRIASISLTLPLIGVVSIGLTLVVVALIVSSGNSRFNLRLRVSKRHRQHCQQRKMFHVSHMNPCSRPAKTPIGSANLLKDWRPFWGSFLPSTPSHCLYLFERGIRRKVAGTGVAHFSHPG